METQVVLHRDTNKGDLLFFTLLYCNDDAQMGPEYILRPPLTPEEITVMKQNMPPAFHAAIERRLETPMDATMYAPGISANGYITACDGLIYHSTSFLHHRGAYALDVHKLAVQKCITKLEGLKDGGRAYVDAQELEVLLPEDDFRAGRTSNAR